MKYFWASNKNHKKLIRWTRSLGIYFKISFTFLKIQYGEEYLQSCKILEAWNTALQELHLNIFNTLPKCPGGYPILHRWLKLNSKISVAKYKKKIHRGQLIFHRGAKQKLCLKYAEIPQNMLLHWPKSKAQRSISQSNFDGPLQNILLRCLCLCVRILRVVAVA